MNTLLPCYTLIKKEILRFCNVPAQTLLAPMVTAALYLFVFGVNLGRMVSFSSDFTYVQFVVPGLILMGIVTNAFMNASSSLFFSCYIGNIVDLLVTPLGPLQLIIAYSLPSIIRGFIVALGVFIVSLFFTSLPWTYPFRVFLIAFLTGLLFSEFGLIAALYSESFEALSMYTNFLIMPLVFLGGLFYPVTHLPTFWGQISKLNPLYYLIDGFRSGLIGHSETPFAISVSVSAGLSLVFFFWAYYLLKTGYRLRP